MMKTMTEEEIVKLEREFERRDKFVLDHGWKVVNEKIVHNGKETVIEAWLDPVNNVVHPYTSGYDQVTMQVLRKSGWKAILEIQHIGKKGFKFFKVQEWGRFQSPNTNIIYSFLEAQYVMERNWDEEGVYPNECSAHTKLRNELVGNNFRGDTVKTWSYQENGQYVFKFWED